MEWVGEGLDGSTGMTKPQPCPKDGTCCSCGYDGIEETKCPKQEDEVHCIHWWEGEEETKNE